MCVQSSIVGRFSPAWNATAGVCKSRFVLPPNAAWTAIALRTDASVSTSRVLIPRFERLSSALAERRAMSSQTG